MEEIEYELIHLENIPIERERGSNTDMGLFIRCLAKKKYSIKWYVLKRKNYFKFNGKSINLQSFEWFEFIIFIKVLRAVTIGIAGPAATEYVGQQAPHSLLPQLLFGSLGLSLLTSVSSIS